MKNENRFILFLIMSIVILVGGLSSCSDLSNPYSTDDDKGDLYMTSTNVYPAIGEEITLTIPDAKSASVKFDFGDGTTGEGASVTKTYETAGAFKIVANVEQNGKKDTITKIVKVARLALTRAMAQFSDPNYKGVWVMAHRGNTLNKSIPENSISAVKAAIAAGVDVVECDPRLTKDGKIVVCHDESISRTTTGKGNISDLTLAQIQSYSLLDRNGNETTDVIPTLEDFLIAGRGKIYFNLDYSPRTASSAQVLEVVRKCGMLEQTFFYTGSVVEDTKAILSLDAAAHPYTWGGQAAYAPLMGLGRNFFVQLDYTAARDGDATATQSYKDGMIVSVNILFNTAEESKIANNDFSLIDKLVSSNVRMIQSDISPSLIRYLKNKGLR
jgi:glycerophosphoryl diester phosphodiesterase